MRSYTEIPTITEEMLDFWTKRNKNVLIYGDHGVGKTSIVKNWWDKIGLNYVMLSGATLDPWTDLVGIPKMFDRDDKTFIKYALPETISEDMEGIFIDEINRAPAKVRNALLELILNKSINGRKFPKLRFIWAAANPPDSNNNYDVEELDPAQEDRFQVIVRLANRPYPPYFAKKYGQEVAEKGIHWHASLTDEIRAFVSPRRLDEAMHYVIMDGGSAREILPHRNINVSAFTKAIKGDARMKALVELVKAKDEEGIEEFMLDQTKLQGCQRDIIKDSKYALLMAKYADMEFLSALAEGEPHFSLLLAEVQREDKEQAIEDFRDVRGKDPAWHTEGQAKSNLARSKNKLFVEELEHFPNPIVTGMKIPDLASVIGIKSEEEILEDYAGALTPTIAPVSREDAINGLRFGIKVLAKGQEINGYQKESQIKFYSLLFSSFNYYYERDGNIIGAIYDVPGSENAVRPLPKIMKPEVVAPNNAGRVVPYGGRKPRGKVTLGELIL